MVSKEKNDKYEPINFNADSVQKSQILDPIYNLNSAFFIFTKKTFEANGNNRLGKNPYYYKLNFPEDLDINYPNDFKIAENLINEYKSESTTKTQRNIVSREYKKSNSIFEVSGVRFGGTHKPIIAGPCSVESKEQLFRIAKQVKKGGAHMLRGGAYKPRTSP